METFFGRPTSREAKARIRKVLGRHLPIGLRALSREARVPERRARRIIERLERDGWLMLGNTVIRVIPAASLELRSEVAAPPPIDCDAGSRGVLESVIAGPGEMFAGDTLTEEGISDDQIRDRSKQDLLPRHHVRVATVHPG
jgi:hypothetical protein